MPQLVYVSNIQKFSTHDGLGIRTNVFFKGCSMNCQWCANPETIEPYPQLMFYESKCNVCGRCLKVCAHDAVAIDTNGSSPRLLQNSAKCRNCGACESACRSHAREINGKLYTPEDIFEKVNQDKVFYLESNGGVTFSGGEPFLNAEFVGKVASKCKAEGYNTAVETCGKFCLEPVLKIIDYIDYLLFDIKIIDDEKHIKYCGQSNKKIHKNFETLLDKADITPRIPIIPGINDTPYDIALLCDFLSRYKGKVNKVHILVYHNMALSKYDALGVNYRLAHLSPPPNEHMQNIKHILENCGFEVQIGG